MFMDSVWEAGGGQTNMDPRYEPNVQEKEADAVCARVPCWWGYVLPHRQHELKHVAAASSQ